tara:strand:+ start:456 stop:2195 length:1740 start_codon:yes stop_codon:yes gene_type:complete
MTSNKRRSRSIKRRTKNRKRRTNNKRRTTNKRRVNNKKRRTYNKRRVNNKRRTTNKRRRTNRKRLTGGAWDKFITRTSSLPLQQPITEEQQKKEALQKSHYGPIKTPEQVEIDYLAEIAKEHGPEATENIGEIGKSKIFKRKEQEEKKKDDFETIYRSILGPFETLEKRDEGLRRMDQPSLTDLPFNPDEFKGKTCKQRGRMCQLDTKMRDTCKDPKVERKYLLPCKITHDINTMLDTIFTPPRDFDYTGDYLGIGGHYNIFNMELYNYLEAYLSYSPSEITGYQIYVQFNPANNTWNQRSVDDPLPPLPVDPNLEDWRSPRKWNDMLTEEEFMDYTSNLDPNEFLEYIKQTIVPEEEEEPPPAAGFNVDPQQNAGLPDWYAALPVGGAPRLSAETRRQQAIDGSEFLQLLSTYKIGSLTWWLIALKVKLSIHPVLKKVGPSSKERILKALISSEEWGLEIIDFGSSTQEADDNHRITASVGDFVHDYSHAPNKKQLFITMREKFVETYPRWVNNVDIIVDETTLYEMYHEFIYLLNIKYTGNDDDYQKFEHMEKFKKPWEIEAELNKMLNDRITIDRI